eukprot:Nk52_evm83s270 gene=Nk52_evmTU83s270
MNLIGKRNDEILFVNFNQDFSCISVGTKFGYKMYNCNPFGKCYSKSDGGTGIVEMLFCTSLVALVGAGEQPAFSPRRLQVCNTKRQSTICELNFVNTILSVKLNRKRLVVVLEDKIHVYDITNMKLLHTVETPTNPKGICALSPNSDNNYLAYPANSKNGEVLVFDTLSLQAANILQAHKTTLSILSFNYTGTMLATSSEKGTLVRVFSVPEGQKLFQFRRGTYPATVYSLSFNIDSTLLAVSSDTETVHIFKLVKQSVPVAEPRSSLSQIKAYLPEALSDIIEPERDFAFVKLPNSNIQNLCALGNSSSEVMVVSAEGYFYLYGISEEGGECNLLKQYSILEPTSENKIIDDSATDLETDPSEPVAEGS